MITIKFTLSLLIATFFIGFAAHAISKVDSTAFDTTRVQLEPSDVYLIDFKFDSIVVEGVESCILPKFKKTICCLLKGSVNNILLNSDSITLSNLVLHDIKYLLIPKKYYFNPKPGFEYRVSVYVNTSRNYLIFNKQYDNNISNYQPSMVKINNLKCYKINLWQKLGLQKKDYKKLREDFFDNFISKVK